VVANALEVAEESQELVRQRHKGEVVQPALHKVGQDTDMVEVRSLAEQDTRLANVVVERMIVGVAHRVVEGMLPKELDRSLVVLAEEKQPGHRHQLEVAIQLVDRPQVLDMRQEQLVVGRKEKTGGTNHL
jgi:hypothetical protein